MSKRTNKSRKNASVKRDANSRFERINLEAFSGFEHKSQSTAIYDSRSPRTLATFRLACEGTCYGNKPGQSGLRDFHFNAEAVRQIGEKLKPDTPFYRGHKSRRKIGSVVGSYLEQSEKGLESFVIGRFPGGLSSDVDICSIEADIEVDEKDYRSVSGIGKVTGIAVDSTRTGAVPGFRDATMIDKMTFLESEGLQEEEDSEQDIEQEKSSQEENVPEDNATNNEGGFKIEEAFKKFSQDMDQKINEKINGIHSKLDEGVEESKRLGWPKKLESLIPKEMSEAHKEIIRTRFADTDNALLSDEKNSKRINTCIEVEIPAYANAFGAVKVDSATPPDSGSDSKEGSNDIMDEAMKWLDSE